MGVYKGAFNMSQEYYSVEKESNLGALNIGLSVFQAIVVKAVESVDGVQFEGNMIPMPGSGPVRTNINKNNHLKTESYVTICIIASCCGRCGS